MGCNASGGAERHRSFDFNSPFLWRSNYAVVSSVLAALLFAASGTAAQPTATPSGRTWQSDGSAANVQRIHDRQASDSDTIVIPKGTFSWTARVNLSKAVTIQGQTTTDTVNGTSVDNTIIVDNIPLAANAGLIHCRGRGGQRITGITFVGGRTQMQGNGLIRQEIGSRPSRFDHLVFDHVYFAPMVQIFTANFGVIDHCIKRNPVGNDGICHIYMSDYGGKAHGDGAFEVPAGYGSPDFFFVEDNYTYGGMDVTHGGKVCVRHNKFFFANMASHGTAQSWHDGRGGRAVEIYNNEWQLAQPYRDLTGSTGGGVVAHDNHIIPFPGNTVNGISMQVYRMMFSYGAPFYGADGANPWDYNATEPDGSHIDGHPPYLFQSGTLSSATTSTVTDSTKNWVANQWQGYNLRRVSDGATALIVSNTNNTLSLAQWQNQGWATGNSYEIHKVLRILDQPGLGQQVAKMDRTQPRWMQQATEPCYEWNNTDQNNKLVHFNVSTASQTILLNRDYFNGTPMPGYTPYAYPHPLTKGLPLPEQTTRNATANSQHNPLKKRQPWGGKGLDRKSKKGQRTPDK